MKYMGSKARHAKEMLPIILAGRKPDQWYVEPFVGGANMIDKVNGNRLGADYNADLIILLKAMSLYDYWVPPFKVTEDQYQSARNCPPSIIKSYIGFGLSYGGKWFGGYRRDKIGKRDYAFEAYKNYMIQAPRLSGVEFRHSDYRDLIIPKQSVIYCDPPYAGTTRYATGDFDHAAFWRWCDTQVEGGHTVFVSEYTAPEGWECVWEKKVNNTLTKDTGSKQGVERLFTRRMK